MGETAFWRRKSLEEMTEAEWESLCDGCGQCCLVRLVEPKSGEIGTTSLACRLLDVKTVRCSDYARRTRKVPGCVKLTPAKARSQSWLPETCAYRRLALGKDLPDWHPLITGRAESTREAGASVADFAMSELDAPIDEPEDLWDWLLPGEGDKTGPSR